MEIDTDIQQFLKSLGFGEYNIHHPYNHFDFTKHSRRILVIGPMGSGKTEYSSRVWRDSQVALNKSELLAQKTTSNGADRRRVFFIRSSLDRDRFLDYPEDALAFRGGYERCGENIAQIRDSFELEQVISDNSHAGTWIIDEATFYDERLAYVISDHSLSKGLIFIFPTLILNFRKDIFNPTARLLLELATDIFPLTAYCEHSDCLTDSFYTYRYYFVNGTECPALYFDPLIIVGGDRVKGDGREPNYCTRCDEHHYLPAKEYTYLTLKPLGAAAASNDPTPLKEELEAIKYDLHSSQLYQNLKFRYPGDKKSDVINMNSLKVDCIAEKAIIYLFVEQNLLSEQQVRELSRELNLDREYMEQRLADNMRQISWED